MTLPIDTASYDYKFNKTLNEDVQLTSNEYGEWDIKMRDKDYVNVTGITSLRNACIIAILTRYGELNDIPTYNGFGDKAYQVIKDNQNRLTEFKIETFIREVLENMRRIRTVNEIIITKEAYHYLVEFTVTSINDELVKGSVSL